MTKYDKFKNKSELLDMKEYLQQIIKSSPEIVEKVIKDRNIRIKSLEADINHRKIVFKEIEERYEVLLKKYKENEKIKEEYEKLKIELKHKTDSLEESRIMLSVNKKEKEGTLSYKLEKISEKIPGWAGKIIFKIIATPIINRAIILAIFCLLFIASITGWGFIADALKPIVAIFE